MSAPPPPPRPPPLVPALVGSPVARESGSVAADSEPVPRPRRGTRAAHLVLPAALLFAAFVHPALPGLFYLLAFLGSVPGGGPFGYTLTAGLAAYSVALVGLHVAGATLVAKRGVGDGVGLGRTLFALGVPRYDVGAWEGVRVLLGPLAVAVACVLAFLQRHPRTGTRFATRAVLLVRAYFAARAARQKAADAAAVQTRRWGTAGREAVSSGGGAGGSGPAGRPPAGGRRRRRRRGATVGGGCMTLEKMEVLVDGGETGEDEEQGMVRRLTAHELDSADLRPAGDSSAALFAAAERIAGGPSRDLVRTDGGRAAADERRGRGEEVDGAAGPRGGDRGGDGPGPPSKLTRFLAGRGGVFWVALSAGLLGNSYCSALTFVALLAVLVVIVAWAFNAPNFAPARRPAAAARALTLARAYTAAYLLAMYVFQFAWLDGVRDKPLAALVGLVPLSTRASNGWAHVMAVGAAVACYVFTTLHARAVASVAAWREHVRPVGHRRAGASDGGDDADVLTDDESVAAACPRAGEATRERIAHACGDGDDSSGPPPRPSGSARDASSGPLVDAEAAAAFDEQQRSVDGVGPPAAGGGAAALGAGAGGEGGSVFKPRLSFNTELILKALMHLSTLGLLAWALVFPGLLTLPLLVAAFANLFSSRWRSRRGIDALVWYAVALEMVQFVFAAVTDSFDILDVPAVRVLGLRTFTPEFAMNLVQTLAVVMLCVNICAKRHLRLHTRGQKQSALDIDKTSLLYFTEVSVKTTAFAPLKVFVDQLALASLYVTGGYEPSALNVLFLLALVAICLFQATRGLRHPKMLSCIWTVIQLYSAAFLLANGAVCRASKELFKCDSVTLGLQVATTGQTVAYATTVVMAAVQVHFTWPHKQDNRDSEHIPEFKTRFWRFLLEYFVFFAYAALLLYPLVYPANYLSYAYMVFLSVCIFVEILAPSIAKSPQLQSARALVRRFWLVVVVFASLALLARYFVRFEQFPTGEYTQMWVFGLGRGVRDFQITLGDAVVLIMMSLQGRIFNISRLLRDAASTSSGESAASSASDDRAAGSSTTSGGGQFPPAPADVVEQQVQDERQEGDPPVRPEEQRRPALVHTHALGAGVPPRRAIRFTVSTPADGGAVSAPQQLISSQPVLFRRTRGPLVGRDDSDNPASNTGMLQTMTMMKKLHNLRKSLPVKQTERFLTSTFQYLTVITRSTLLQYNYVFEAIAILVAAVWLDGVTVFGAVYLVIGCVLMVSGQFFQERRPRAAGGAASRGDDAPDLESGSGGDASSGECRDLDESTRRTSTWSARYLPPVLVLLSFCLMSIQYLYIIFSSSGVTWGAVAEYIGLQPTPLLRGKPDVTLLPIRQNAMLAHVLVFVMAFLQRAAIRWVSLDEERARAERRSHVVRMASPLLSGDVYSAAVSVSAVYPGVGGSSALAPAAGGGRAGERGGRGEASLPPASSDLKRSTSSFELDSAAMVGMTPVDTPPGPLKLVRSMTDVAQATKQRDSVEQLRLHHHGQPLRGAGQLAGAGLGGSAGSSVDGEIAGLGGGESGRARELGGRLDSSSRNSSGNFSGVDFLGGERDEASTAMQKIRRGVLACGRTVGKRAAEILSLLTPFWQNWGFDLTFIYLVVGGAVTKTVFSVIYVTFVLFIGRLTKKQVERRWRAVTLALVFLVVLQYLLTLGVPPESRASASPDAGGADGPVVLNDSWTEWLYLDSLQRGRAVFEPAKVSRKAGITFGFLAVICAGITFNALDEDRKAARGWDSRQESAGGSTGSIPEDDPVRAANKTLADVNRIAHSERNARVRIVRYQTAGIAVHAPAPAAPGAMSRFMSGLGMRSSSLEADDPARGNVRVRFGGSGGAAPDGEEEAHRPAPREPGQERSGANAPGGGGGEDAHLIDFTSKPRSFRNYVKLTWMRFAGSLVQLFMFGIATWNTNLLSAVLLVLALYFFLQFTNTETKQTRFVFVRTYVLLVILVLVCYQAPFAAPAGSWDDIIGLYKAEDNRLLYLMLALWLLCQMQSRIYESSNFKFVVQCTREDENVRHRRAVHEHNDRLYEKMLGRNKNERAKKAREARVSALTTLKEMHDGMNLKARSERKTTDLFFRVCVTNWVAYLRRRAESPEHKEQRATELHEALEKEAITGGMGPRERALRYLLRGPKWHKHSNRTVYRELTMYVTRYSSWPVYFAMTLAPVAAPSIFTLVYPVVLFLYLIVEQPRPPKQAWTALIVYVYAVILVKYIGRKPEFVKCDDGYAVPLFGVSGGLPFSSSNIPSLRNFGWCAMSTGIAFDVIILLFLMWHRAQLYYRGLWDLPRTEEEMRLNKKISGENVPETRSDMQFMGFDEADVQRVYAFGIPGDEPLGRGDDLANDESASYAFVPMKEQCIVANDVMKKARAELQKFADGRQSDAPDQDALVGGDLSDRKSAVFDRLAQFTEGDFRPEKISKGRGHGAGGAGGSSGVRAPPLPPPSRRASEFIGSSSKVGGPQTAPSVPGPGSESTGGGEAPGHAQVVKRGAVYEEDTSGLRNRRASASLSRPGTGGRSVAERVTVGRQDSGGPDSPRFKPSVSHRSIDSSVFVSLMRRKSRTLRPVEEEEEGVGGDGDGGAVAETAGPAVDALVQSNFVHKGGNARISSHLAPQGRPDSGPKKPEAGDASLSGLRAGGDGGGFFGPVRRHFTTLLRENAHKTVGDYYMAIFSIDFICFVYMMFGYSYMFETQNDSTKILSWWQSNYIGGNHLLSLMIMFLGIIGDRVVYLRRSMVGKLGIQYLSVLGYHYWLFWETNTGTRNVGKGFYFLKCIYFLLSGIQIRTGYPLYTTGQYLLRQYSTGGLVLFTIYENIPFLWLTRTLLDWAVVPTSLEIFQYFRFIDIYLWLYRNRAVNYSRGLFRRRLGQKRFWFPRVYQGLGLALLCGLLLFLPFILFSFLNPFYAQRALFESKLDVDFVDSGSTYRAFSRSTGTDRLPKKGPDGGRLAVFERVYGVKTVLRENEALFLAQFSALSESLWQPVASDVEMLIQSLESDDNKPLLQFTLASMTDTQIFRTFESLELSDESRSKIARALRASEPFAVRMNTTLSKHLILASGSKQFESAENNAANKGTCLRLVYASRDAARPIAFWSMEDCVSDCVCEKIDATAGGPAELAANFSIKQHSVQVLLQVANVSSFQFGGGTILTVYAAILFTVASLAKRLLSNKRLIVPFIDMPYTLHLYQLVLDIVYARQDKDFVMEEILYNGLIDIYRDPSELVKWSGQRALKTEDEWWADEGRTKIEGYDGCPSFRETLTEPYFERIVE